MRLISTVLLAVLLVCPQRWPKTLPRTNPPLRRRFQRMASGGLLS